MYFKTSNMKTLWLLIAALVFVSTSGIPVESDNESETSLPVPMEKRQTTMPKLGLMPPYGFMPPFMPWYKMGKYPFMYPFMTPDMYGMSDPLADPKTAAKRAISDTSDPANSITGSGKFYKDKKNEFLTALFQKLASTTEASPVKRAVTGVDSASAVPLPPMVDPSFFINKKYEFLSKLFTMLNTTTTPAPVDEELDPANATTTIKPTIVPADFWVPFPFLIKPSKAPKPPKPPKVKEPKVTTGSLISKITLADLIENPTLLDSLKRSAPVPPAVIPLDYYIPPKLDPTAFSDKFSAYLDKFFKKLNKTDATGLSVTITPKATIIPSEFWKPTPPQPTVYSSQVDAFLDLLFKSLDAGKIDKSSKTVKRETKRVKRSFFDDFFSYGATPSSSEPVPESLKRSLPTPESTLPFDTTGLTPQQIATSLILSHMGTLKNDIISAYDEALKTQKATETTTPSPSKKSKAVPIWAKFKAASTTVDPLTPIQKRIELVNSMFDMLTQVEQELVAGQLVTPEPNAGTNITALLQSIIAGTTPKPTIVPPSFWAPDPTSLVPPDSSYYISKTQEFLNKLFESKMNTTSSTFADY